MPIEGQLLCPVFRQNKWDLIIVIPQHVNPTLKISIKESYSEEEIAKIRVFWETYCTHKNRGGFLKAPFTTGKKWARHVFQLDRPQDFHGVDPRALFVYLKSAYMEFNDIFDYMLLQPCIDVEVEAKSGKISQRI
jgi:hypothetical protein